MNQRRVKQVAALTYTVTVTVAVVMANVPPGCV
jgi:hypothetical protein